MARRPKTTLISHPSAYYQRRMMLQTQITGVPTPGHSWLAGLYNENPGQLYLVLWHVEVGVKPPGAGTAIQKLLAGWTNEPPPISPSVGIPMYPLDSKCVGSIWGELDSGVSWSSNIDLTLSANRWYWPHDWPLVIVPPGWSWTLATLIGEGGTLDITWVWEVCPDPPDWPVFLQ